MADNFFPLTDLGNAERFIENYKEETRFSAQLKTWLHWTGKVWQQDIGEVATLTKAKQTVRYINNEVGFDPSLKEEIIDHAKKSESISKINALIKLARSAPELQIQIGQLDADPWLLNCLNGTVDLTTGNLYPHDKNQFITRIIKTPFIRESSCPLFTRFLADIMNGDQEMVGFLQRVLGYGLTGSGREQVLFFLTGNGANGKTTLIETIRKVLGPFVMHTPTATLIKNSLQIRNDIARLKGARIVTASEMTKNKALDESTTKMLTGEDPVTSRFLYRELFEYRPTFKIFLLANHLPEISGNDFGIWRRILLIPFLATFKHDCADKNLQTKLAAEAPGILAWLVEGCLKWLHQGLNIPTKVKVATEDYREETDFLKYFIADCFERDSAARTPSKFVYDTYKNWAMENSDSILTQKALGCMLKTADFKPAKSNGIRYWRGLRLKSKSDTLTTSTNPQHTTAATGEESADTAAIH